MLDGESTLAVLASLITNGRNTIYADSIDFPGGEEGLPSNLANCLDLQCGD